MKAFIIFPFIAVIVVGFSHADLSSDIESITGNRTKIVFAKCLIDEGDRDCFSPNYSLVGFDTYRQAFFEIVSGPRSCANPIITPDGNNVIFSDYALKTVYCASWCGLAPRVLTGGYGLCVQRDTVTGTDWVYVSDSAYGYSIYRYDLSDISRRELVWNKTRVSIRFTVSADGRFGGGEFPWPSAGEVTLPNIEFQAFQNGCNAAIAPDNSYRLFRMDGDHRSIYMYDSGGANVRNIRLDNAPGVDSTPVWIPRWSSDARFFTMTAPCQFSPKTHLEDIYLGRFNEAHDSVAKWVRVTNTADTFENYAYAWVGRQRYVKLGKYEINLARSGEEDDTLSEEMEVALDPGAIAGCRVSSSADWLLLRAIDRGGVMTVENAIDTTRAMASGLYSTVVTLHCNGYADESYRVNLRVGGVLVPTALTIKPRDRRIRQIDSVPFTATCFDQFHNPLSVICRWSLTGGWGGALNNAKVFRSNGDTGVFVIRAWVFGSPTITDSTTVRVYENPRIISPDIGVKSYVGDSLIIRWVSHLPEFINLLVYLSADAGRNWLLLNPVKAIYPDYDTCGRFAWLITSSVCGLSSRKRDLAGSDSCLIKITDYSNQFSAVSENPFGIACNDSQGVRRSVFDLGKKSSRYPFLRGFSPDEIVSLAIYTLSGRLITGYKEKAGRIRIGSLPNGVYIVRISANSRRWSERFIVW